MYISLGKLSQEETPAGELAACLLGKEASLDSRDVAQVLEAFNTSFEQFKLEKDVMKVLSFRERWFDDGRIEGKAEGKAEGKIEGILEAAIKLLENGVDFNFVIETLQLSDSEIAQLKSAIA